MQINIKKSAKKSLAKLDENERWRIARLIDKIELLSDISKIPHGRKLKGYVNRYKIRAGNYRIVYKVENKIQITITAIAHRKDIYNNLLGLVL